MHNLFLALLLATAVQPRVSVSLAARVDPAAQLKHDEIASELSPSAKSKLQNVVSTLRSSSAITDGTSRAAVASAFPIGSLAGADIEALVFYVMMEAANGAEQDLRSIMEENKKMEEQKQALRAAMTVDGKFKTAHPRVAKVTLQSSPVAIYRAPAPLPPNATIEQMQKRLDDLDQLETLNQIRIQALTNQQQQATAVMSNVMKSIHDSHANVIRNLR
jgi:hypothetical protein